MIALETTGALLGMALLFGASCLIGYAFPLFGVVVGALILIKTFTVGGLV